MIYEGLIFSYEVQTPALFEHEIKIKAEPTSPIKE